MGLFLISGRIFFMNMQKTVLKYTTSENVKVLECKIKFKRRNMFSLGASRANQTGRIKKNES